MRRNANLFFFTFTPRPPPFLIERARPLPPSRKKLPTSPTTRTAARPRATPPWPRPPAPWSPSGASRCGRGGPSGATCPRSTPCTGARNLGTEGLIFSLPFRFRETPGRPQQGVRHEHAPGHGQCGADRSHPDAQPADPQGPPGQDLRHALGERQQVQYRPGRRRPFCLVRHFLLSSFSSIFVLSHHHSSPALP